MTKEEINSYLKKFYNHWDQYWKFTTETSKGLCLWEIRSNIEQRVPLHKFKNRLKESVMYRLRIGHAGVNK